MKLTIKTKLLASALALIKPIAKQNSTNAIFGNVALVASYGKLHLRGTDMEKELRLSIDADIEVEGATTLPCARLHDLLAGESAPDTEISTNEKHLTVIKCGRAVSKMTGLAEAEMPAKMKCDAIATLEILPTEFADALAKCLTHASAEDKGARAVYCSVRLDSKDGKLRFMATDGRRMMIHETEVAFESKQQFVIPRNSVADMVKVATGELVKLSLGENILGVASGDSELFTKLFEAPYQDFDRVKPADNSITNSITANRLELIEAATRAEAVLMPLDIKAVSLLAEHGTLTISAISKISNADQTERVISAKSKERISIAINPGFLRDALKSMSEESITMKCRDEMTAIVICEDKITCVLMPMRVS